MSFDQLGYMLVVSRSKPSRRIKIAEGAENRVVQQEYQENSPV